MTIDAPSVILRQLLIDNSVGTDPTDESDWPIYVSHEPDGDGIEDDLITIYDTSATKDGRLMTGANIIHEGCMLRVRVRGYTAGWAKMRSIYNTLENVLRNTVVIGAVTYNMQNVNIMSSILPLGIPEDDTKRRDLFTLNILITINEIE